MKIGGFNLKAFDGRDPLTADFDLTTLTVADVWTELDLSGIIPVGTRMVYFQCGLVADAPANYMSFRRKGDSGGGQCITAQVAFLEIWKTFLVQVGSDGKIEYYKHAPSATFLDVSVFGWFT